MEIEDAPFRGEIRLACQRRVSHGLGVTRRIGLTEHEEFLRDLRAYLLVVPPSAVFTHLTGARLRRWQLPTLPEQVPVFVAVDGDDRRPRRHGLICSRLVRYEEPGPPERRDGLPVERAEEILLRAARDLGLLDLVVLVDSARAVGDVDTERMERILKSRRPGVRMLRQAWIRSTGRAESGPETLLQQLHRVLDVPFTPQAEILDEDGRLVARADLLVDGTTQVHEYDGAHHRDGRQHRVDLRRERALLGAGYSRRGFVLDDLLNHAGAVMQEIDRALARAPDPRRLAEWRRLLDNSLYSATGRERVMNRWRRQHGIADWSKSA